MARKDRRDGRTSVGTPATAALDAAGVHYLVHAFDPPGAGESATHGSFGEVAAAALGVDPYRVHKTLIARVDGSLVVAVVPVSGRLDLKSLAAAVGGKRAELAEPEAAERSSGYVVGGISPFGQRRRLRTVLDASAWEHPTIFVSAGRRGVDLELSPTDLVQVLDAVSASLSRP